jgi:uncharacterized protein YkwD
MGSVWLTRGEDRREESVPVSRDRGFHDQRESTGMTPIGAPMAVRALLVTAAGGVLLVACGAGGRALQEAAVPVPTTTPIPTTAPSADDADAAPAAAPAASTSTPSTASTSRARGTQRRTQRATNSRTTRPSVRATPTRTSPRPTHRPTPRTTTKPAPSTPTRATGLTGDEAQVLALVNKERASAGCGVLRSNAILVSVARAHSKDMGVHGYFDHTSRDGRSPFDRIRAAGYKGGLMGENIAAGQSTPAAVMDAWMHSAGHRANILNCGYKVVGIGVAKVSGSPYRIYWTQDFGDR